ncbi:hypothetical protein USDA257_p03150 (plasmid) [Sinorhizobium fredii USDA 257]|uniref:Uncharacterized protein n=1 Tax=Sinorhizobium fredii (strain USDA 257) TaxID=1185652 RepID=I3XGM4_SINF2|nr:hypothetical protein USDA257_p03150 [Sinorhizobium fredii USDA 257]
MGVESGDITSGLPRINSWKIPDPDGPMVAKVLRKEHFNERAQDGRRVDSTIQ